MMLLRNGMILTLQQGLQIDSWFHIMPFKWDDNNNEFNIENKRLSKAWRLMAFLYFCVTGILMLFSCWLNGESYNTAEKSQTLVTATALLLCGTIFWTLHTENINTIAMLNGFLKLEEEMEQDEKIIPKDTRTILITWIGKLLVVSGKCYAVLTSIVSGFDPKFPTNTFALYWPAMESSESVPLHILHRVVTMAVNLVVWHIISLSGLITCLEMIISMEAARVYQLSLLNYTKTTGCLEMWVKIGQLYRRLRLLIQMFNHVHAKAIVVHLLIFLSVSEVSSVYSLIRCEGIPFPILITLLFIASDAYITIIGVYGCAGVVNKTSKQVTADLRRKSVKVRSCFVKKTMSGFPDLRIGFGSVNFIEVITPLEFLNFNNLRIVDLLLFNRQ
ncbi:unnamed protein product [Orchesella dallaii]|uniref:Gustatory receptor n=1 Tax=Orchesella dallaii TaxID=48710 RepID=A0ABP1R6G5_9HEXA